jgi:hypothetical protein
MRKNFLLAVTAPVWLSVCTAMAQTPTAKIVNAANAFLATLDPTQKQNVAFAFNDEEQRKRWSNLPISIVARKGISFKEMTPSQSAAAMALLGVMLSPRGLEKVKQIMEADEVLKNQEGNRPGGRAGGPPNGGPPDGGRGGRGGGRGPGGGLLFGKDLYFISFLGTPSLKDPWLVQFGGHHLALNITIAGNRGVLTPTLTGAQPALYTSNGKVVRPLAGESDKALALLNSLDENQRKQAILNFRSADLVLGPGQDGKTIAPEGLKASAMTEKQKAMLLDVVSEWAGIINETEAATRMAELKADVNETWFAWSGNTTAAPGANITAYYRIQGPHLVIEYAPQNMGGDPSLHVHTMYRDPTNDYGRSSAAR